MMNSFDEKSLNYSIELVKNRYSSFLNESDFVNIKKRVSHLISNQQFQLIIEDAVFKKEQSLLYKNELKIIDLLAIKGSQYFIFDYKTTKEQHEEHDSQVKFYKEAILDIEKNSEVFTYILYLNENETVLKEIK